MTAGSRGRPETETPGGRSERTILEENEVQEELVTGHNREGSAPFPLFPTSYKGCSHELPNVTNKVN